MTPRPRVGIVGLARRCARYLPALAGPNAPLEVSAVYDATPGRAARVAQRLGCAEAAGVVDLLDRPEVEALLLFDAGWHGLWPLERAAAAGKPAFSDLPLHHDDAHSDALRERLAAGTAPVLFAPSPALAPGFREIQNLLAEQFGAARIVRWELALSCRGTRVPRPAAVLRARPLLGMLHACAGLFGGTPAGVVASAPEGTGFAHLLLDFPGGRAAQLTVTAGPRVRPGSRLCVTAGGGGVTATLPRKLRWSDDGGDHALRLPPYSAAADLLCRFARLIPGGEPTTPSFDAVYQALAWWRAAGRSQSEGRRVEIGAFVSDAS